MAELQLKVSEGRTDWIRGQLELLLQNVIRNLLKEVCEIPTREEVNNTNSFRLYYCSAGVWQVRANGAIMNRKMYNISAADWYLCVMHSVLTTVQRLFGMECFFFIQVLELVGSGRGSALISPSQRFLSIQFRSISADTFMVETLHFRGPVYNIQLTEHFWNVY